MSGVEPIKHRAFYNANNIFRDADYKSFLWRAKNEYNLNTMAAVNLKIGILETAIEEDATDAFINGRTDNLEDLDVLTVEFLET